MVKTNPKKTEGPALTQVRAGDGVIHSSVNRPPRAAQRIEEKSRTDKSFGNEVNINKIMDRYVKSGQIDPQAITRRAAAFGDFTEVGDYQDCLLKVENAKAQFATLPSHVRARFDNDPAQLLDFISDAQNAAEAAELGLTEGTLPEEGSRAAQAPQEAPEGKPPKTEG